MKDYSKADQVAAKIATESVVENKSFWDQVQEQWEKMTSGPEIKPRQEPKNPALRE